MYKSTQDIDVEATVTSTPYTYRYDISDEVIYVGKATPGSSEASSVWTVQKVTFDANGNATAKLQANNVSWDNRLSEVYI